MHSMGDWFVVILLIPVRLSGWGVEQGNYYERFVVVNTTVRGYRYDNLSVTKTKQEPLTELPGHRADIQEDVCS